MRAVGTNTLRVAKNAKEFLRKAEAALGFPIEVVAGREEARLIYLGVAHSLPVTGDKRLVVDIGGGSTEFIIGSGYQPQQAGEPVHGLRQLQPEVLSRRQDQQEQPEAGRARRAHRAADHRAGVLAPATGSRRWAPPAPRARSADILEANGWSDGGITPDGLERLRSAMLKAGDIEQAVDFPGLQARPRAGAAGRLRHHGGDLRRAEGRRT